MCGICGYVGDHAPDLLPRMADAIKHRGPDGTGTWHDEPGQVGFAHQRLAIIDLTAAGHQPMTNEDGRVWVTFNGEIYNFETLRATLCSQGHTFKSHCDTEVLLHLYEERGVDLVHDLNGMFAFGIWDKSQRQLLLARDGTGIKPLYYYVSGSRLYFASEIKSLLRIPGVPREVNRNALGDYLTFLWVPGDQTMLKGIQKLEPGHRLIWKDGHFKVERWFNLEYQPDTSASVEEWTERVHDTFIRVTKRQMVSDVPLGAFLSGGVDSSSIVACMRQAFPGRKITCYTARSTEEENRREGFADDYPYARRVAEHLDVELKELVLQPDVMALLPKMVWHLDEPDADPAIFPSYLISQMARDDGTTVLLSGTGGDEVFFGYRSHQAYRRYAQMNCVPRAVGGMVLAGSEWMLSKLRGRQSASVRRVGKFRRGWMANGLDRHLTLVDWSAAEVRDRLLIEPSQRLPAMRKYYDEFTGSGEVNRHSHMLVQTFLAAHNFLYTDKTSMAASIEVRVPFMDLELMRLTARIPEEMQMFQNVPKYLLKRAMQRYLPHDVLHRSKTGFMAPLRKWIETDMRGLVDEMLSEREVRKRGIFNPAAVQSVIREHRSGAADHAYLIFALLFLEVWQRTFIDRPGEQLSL